MYIPGIAKTSPKIAFHNDIQLVAIKLRKQQHLQFYDVSYLFR